MHILNKEEVDYFLRHVHLELRSQRKLVVYGPFNYNNNYTRVSNREFDCILREKSVGSCIKSFESVNHLLIENHFKCIKDVKMPANNHFIVWELKSE